MKQLTNNILWDIFASRALAYIVYGGADLGECLATLDSIAGDEPGDWYRAWTNTAERVLGIARASESAGHVVSAREAYFRASSYYRVSYLPLFRAPADPWLVDAFQRETDAFQSGARLNDFPIQPVEVPFETRTLPGYFVRPSNDSTPRPTILHVNGYDGTVQEMYFAHAVAAVRRGYNCLLIDGPGQGRNLFCDNIPIRPDWETVVRAVVDYLLTKPEVDPKRIVLAGWSFGGFLAPRAAAFEHRIAALIADPGQWDQKPDLSVFHLPEDVVKNFPNIDPSVFEPIEHFFRSPKADPLLRWKVLQRGCWVHGVPSIFELVKEMSRFEISSVAHQIACPTLLTAAPDDPVSANSQILFDALRCPKRIIRFTAEEGASGHCESFARSLYHQRAFDWLDEVLQKRA